MTPAVWPRGAPLAERLVRADPARGALVDAHVRDLPALLRANDLVVVNDAATIPASLAGRDEHGAPVELRLASVGRDDRHWAVLFGPGDWRTPTEDRAPPARMRPGERIEIQGLLVATVAEVSALSPRLLRVRFDRRGAALWSALYHAGRPIQYAHLAGPLPLWHAQTAYAARPWAVELPSAGRPVTAELLLALRHAGIAVHALTHGCGLSATGDRAIDAALPLPERYEIPASLVHAVSSARARGGRVVAVGTSVVRALEGSADAHGGVLVAGEGETDLRLGPGFRPRVVDGLLTGLHEPGTSHHALLQAFASDAVLARIWSHAEAQGYLLHEFGDSSLLLPD